jgi:hypothetical protein
VQKLDERGRSGLEERAVKRCLVLSALSEQKGRRQQPTGGQVGAAQTGWHRRARASMKWCARAGCSWGSEGVLGLGLAWRGNWDSQRTEQGRRRGLGMSDLGH